jgi:two-component system alkaline phosphatase synthesis response regulator PhoP
MSGFEVLSAYDGEKGLAAAQASRPDLIVLDLQMPRMHGYEVCQAVRADKEISKTKIVITTGKGYLVDMKTAMDLGADRFVLKPYGIKQLVGLIEELIGKA